LPKEFAAKEKLVPIFYEWSEFTKSMILDSEAIGKIVIDAAPPPFLIFAESFPRRRKWRNAFGLIPIYCTKQDLLNLTSPTEDKHIRPSDHK